MNWTQVLNKHQKVKFYNPIKQNNTHIKAIKKVLNNKKIQEYYSIITFASKSSELKKIEIESENIHVTKVKYVIKLINQICSSTDDVFTWQEVEQIYNIIQQNQIKEKNTKKEHIKNVNKYKSNK